MIRNDRLWAKRILNTDPELDQFSGEKIQNGDSSQLDPFPDPDTMEILHRNWYILDPDNESILMPSMQNG